MNHLSTDRARPTDVQETCCQQDGGCSTDSGKSHTPDAQLRRSERRQAEKLAASTTALPSPGMGKRSENQVREQKMWEETVCAFLITSAYRIVSGGARIPPIDL